VPRCGAGSLVKIVVRKSMCQGVMVVQVGTSSRRRFYESSLRPSACLCEDLLQLKHVTSKGCPIEGVIGGEDECEDKVVRWPQICMESRSEEYKKMTSQD
jgi:hypothetical protein